MSELIPLSPSRRGVGGEGGRVTWDILARSRLLRQGFKRDIPKQSAAPRSIYGHGEKRVSVETASWQPANVDAALGPLCSHADGSSVCWRWRQRVI